MSSLTLPASTKDAVADRADAEFDVELIKGALDAVPADEYGTWIDVLRALKGGAKRAGVEDDVAKELAREWSATSKAFDARVFEQKWSRAFRREDRGEGRSLGTLFHVAGKHGWERPHRTYRVTGFRIQESDPPIFLATIAGSNVEVPMEAADLCSPQKFQQAVLRKTYKLINRPKLSELAALLDKAERIPADDHSTELGRFRYYLYDFFNKYLSSDKAKLKHEHAWHDESKNRIWFRWPDFDNYLKRQRVYDFKLSSDALRLVRALGGSNLDTVNLGEGRGSLRCWWVPTGEWQDSTNEPPLAIPDVRRKVEAPF